MVTILQGDCLTVLKTLPTVSIHCCVTSPPYFNLRDYGIEGQIGMETSVDEYVAKLVLVFTEVKRVLREDGTAWINVGDSYFGSGQGYGDTKTTNKSHHGSRERQKPEWNDCGLKPKDLIGIPWMVAFALRADGWYLRSDIIWHKPNPMPESVTDRPTKSHEYIFLLTKSAKYYYDAEAIKEEAAFDGRQDTTIKPAEKYRGRQMVDGQQPQSLGRGNENERWPSKSDDGTRLRNKRSVWTVATSPYSGAHFATFPPKLITPCIQAGCPERGTVLDPFGGSGTVGEVAENHGRNSILIELKPEYCGMAKKRTAQQGLFC